MRVVPILETRSLRVTETHCDARPSDAPFPEEHTTFVVAYVQRGSFGYRTRGRHFELVVGSLLLGRPGDEYVCTHEHHHGGDACLALHLSETLVDDLGGFAAVGEASGVPPLPGIMVMGELAQAAAAGHTRLDLEEAALAFLGQVAELRSGRERRHREATARDRRRAVEAALWIEDNASRPVALEDAAAQVDLSPYHFLRLFSRTLGVTPHQYLIRARLRNASRWLCEGGLSTTEVALRAGFGDLSHFVRTFQRAAGIPPGAFRRRSRRERDPLTRRLDRC